MGSSTVWGRGKGRDRREDLFGEKKQGVWPLVSPEGEGGDHHSSSAREGTDLLIHRTARGTSCPTTSGIGGRGGYTRRSFLHVFQAAAGKQKRNKYLFLSVKMPEEEGEEKSLLHPSAITVQSMEMLRQLVPEKGEVSQFRLQRRRGPRLIRKKGRTDSDRGKGERRGSSSIFRSASGGCGKGSAHQSR